MIACSTPPVYWLTGIQRSTSSRRNGPSSSPGEQYRKRYHEESTNVSMVSVSRRASPLHVGQTTLDHEGCRANGDSPPGWKSTSSGKSTGSSASGTATSPHVPQWMIGIGAPQ